MSIIQKRADQLIAPANAISRQIRDYQEDCKNKGIKNDKEFIDSKYEALCEILPAFKSQKSNFIDSQNRVKSQDLFKQIVPSAYALSSSENYIEEDQEDTKLTIPIRTISINEMDQKEIESMYEEINIYTTNEGGEAVYDQVDNPAVMIPKLQKIDTEKLSLDINALLNSKIISLKKNFEEQLKTIKNDYEAPTNLQVESQDIKFEAAQLISDMLKNNGVLAVTSQSTGQTINLDLNQSLKLSSAKDRYSDLASNLLSNLLESNGVVKIKVPKEVISKLPNGETLKSIRNTVEFGSNAMITDFFQTLLTNQNVTDATGKSVSLIDRWLSIADSEFHKKIETWLKENSAYIDSAENNSKFFNFFVSNVDEAQRQIHATYFPTTDPKDLGINSIDNPFVSVQPQYDSINQFNPMSASYQQPVNNNQLPPVTPDVLPSTAPIGGVELYNNQVAKTQPQGEQMSLAQLTNLL